MVVQCNITVTWQKIYVTSQKLKFLLLNSYLTVLSSAVPSQPHHPHLRAAPRKYQLDLEIAKKSNFSKLAQNEALRALVTKILF